MQWQNRSSVHSKKSASGSGYIKPGTWPGRIFSITLKCSTTVTDATATSVASARRPSKRPRREDRNCLPERGHSNPNHVWGMDFVSDALFDGRRLRLLTVIDLYTRECLEICVGQNLRLHGGRRDAEHHCAQTALTTIAENR